ncbi:MAG: MipA/OmpV family protein [Solimonas sp.]
MTTPARRRAASRLLRAPLLALPAAFAVPVAAQTLPTPNEQTTQPRDTLPKWEAGVLFAGLTLPDYPASDEYRTIVVPVPYFVYRGRTLRSSEEEGSRLRQKLAPNVEIDVSGGGALSSDSNGSKARRGMPDLDYLVELGPNLRLSYDGPRPHSQIVVNLPLRAVVSLGSGVDWQGVLFAPELAYISERFLGGRLSLRGSLSSEFSSTQLQRYFYGVAPRYATAERPAYQADAGYLGSSLGLRASYAFTPTIDGFIGLRWYNHAGAANADSPLFRNENGYSATLGVSWSFWESKEMAED